MPDMGKGQAATVRLWQAAVPHVARRADRVIAISEASARHVREHLRVDPARIDVIPLGYSPRPRAAPTAGAGAARAGSGSATGPIVLNVAMKKVHKNQRRLVQALPRIREAVPGAQLVLAGAPTPYEAELRAEARALGLERLRRAAGLRRRRRPRGPLRRRVRVRVPVAQRGLRAAGAGGDGPRAAGRDLRPLGAARGRRRRGAARRPGVGRGDRRRDGPRDRRRADPRAPDRRRPRAARRVHVGPRGRARRVASWERARG